MKWADSIMCSTIGSLKRLYHCVKRKTGKFILRLCIEEKIWLAAPLSGIARKFFLREFSVKQINYRNINELKQLVLKATMENAENSIKVDENSSIPSGLKILLIFNSKTNFENVWVKTAINAGFDVDTFWADRISALPTDISNLEIMEQESKKLLCRVRDFRPRLIFLDINYMGNQNTINNRFIKEIRAAHNCIIAGHIGDYYSKEAVDIASYWSKSLDVVLHSAPGSSCEGIQNLHYVHYFINEKCFFPLDEKRMDIFFSGSGNISRYPYLTFAKIISKRRGYKSLINVHNNHDSSALSFEDYSQLIRESHAVLNLSARTAPNVRVVTGRALEAIASKSLLIEEKNNAITNILTPYAHFIPFDSKEELAIALDFSVNCRELAGKIVEGAYKKYWLEHNSKIGWSRILRLCKL